MVGRERDALGRNRHREERKDAAIQKVVGRLKLPSIASLRSQ
jgi:hypothetical protein